ncbi:MAG: lipoate--protein ligase [Abditibacteriota bacterium]|nr:lipoate--protein ligase [Abditibacteriota bacterium]
MLYIYNACTDPYFNMACEEYLLKDFPSPEPVFMLWQNSPAIIIGKNQNTLEEINLNYVKQSGIAVVRRLSGGGAVYHDKGNLNFTIITRYQSGFLDSMDMFTRPVIGALEDLGVKAELKGRNDISIGGRKFSGNSQTVAGGRILHHGTIMLDVNTDVLSKALAVPKAKIESKGIKSVRKRVTNVNAHLAKPVTPEEFASLLRNRMAEEYPLEDHSFGPEDTAAITKLRNGKYITFEWNYGTSPSFTYSKQIKLPAGLIRFSFNTQGSVITEAAVTGDFFGVEDISGLCRALAGVRFTREALTEAFLGINTEKYISFLKKEEIPGLCRELFE